jgi:mercuric reductase
MTFNMPELIEQKDELIRTYRQQHYASLLAHNGMNGPRVVYGHATLVDPHTVEVRASDGSLHHLRGEQILIATGSSPSIPAFAGLAETPYLTSDLLGSQENLGSNELPETLLIVGGGYIALELGQMFSRLGSQITLLVPSERILKDYEPEISQALTSILRQERMQVVSGVQVQQVSGDSERVQVTALVRGARRGFQANKLLLATGRRPNTANLGLERIGVRLDAQGAVVVDDYLRTSVPHIWAAGDVIGRKVGSQMATPVGAQEGGIAASNALADARQSVDLAVIPRAVFTDPPVGVVGLTEAQAQARGLDTESSTVFMKVVPRANIIRDTRGVIKMVLERESRRVLGVSMLGVSAEEVINEAAMALRFHASVEDFINLIHVYPTMAEALKIVAISFTRDVTELSCCAS